MVGGRLCIIDAMTLKILSIPTMGEEVSGFVSVGMTSQNSLRIWANPPKEKNMNGHWIGLKMMGIINREIVDGQHGRSRTTTEDTPKEKKDLSQNWCMPKLSNYLNKDFPHGQLQKRLAVAREQHGKYPGDSQHETGSGC